jgi:hypothetical protein
LLNIFYKSSQTEENATMEIMEGYLDFCLIVTYTLFWIQEFDGLE